MANIPGNEKQSNMNSQIKKYIYIFIMQKQGSGCFQTVAAILNHGFLVFIAMRHFLFMELLYTEALCM